MGQETKDCLIIVLCFIALIVAFYFLGKSEGFQAKIDDILFGQENLYALERKNTQGDHLIVNPSVETEAILTDDYVFSQNGLSITVSFRDPKKVNISIEKEVSP